MRHSIPRYCCNKAKGLAFVKLNGRRHYLGAYDSPESRQRYDELLAAWLPTRSLLEDDPDEPAGPV
jgi:hypothetical protein